jgi:hypothetical protein
MDDLALTVRFVRDEALRIVVAEAVFSACALRKTRACGNDGATADLAVNRPGPWSEGEASGSSGWFRH